MQEMLDDASVRAIMIARGGYGTVRVIDKLRWDSWLQNPSWICGYSDITVLLSHVINLNVASIHSTMPISFPDATPAAMDNLAKALSGRLEGMSWDTSCGGDLEMTARFIGGNLSVLYSLMGSSSYPNLGGGILFVEDVDEMIYHVDRMMEGLKRGGGLLGVKAIVVGGLTLMKDNTIEHSFPMDNPFGGDALSAIQRVATDLGIPVIDGFPAGHLSDNRAFYNGREVHLMSKEGNAKLIWI
jgi:muramoyltetrapeptide carboxypeptidase